ncbi:SH2D5 protein, partial [Acromyrmex heyeri]
MGSFPVAIPDIPSRAEFVRSQLEILRFDAFRDRFAVFIDRAVISRKYEEYSDRFTPVLLIVSLAGIKVCSPDGKCVQMAHALRRIFYATCEPQHAQFSFLAREPGAHFSLQYCHSFITESAEQLPLNVFNAAVEARKRSVGRSHRSASRKSRWGWNRVGRPESGALASCSSWTSVFLYTYREILPSPGRLSTAVSTLCGFASSHLAKSSSDDGTRTS